MTAASSLAGDLVTAVMSLLLEYQVVVIAVSAFVYRRVAGRILLTDHHPSTATLNFPFWFGIYCWKKSTASLIS